MDIEFGDLLDMGQVVIYLDNILIFATTLAELKILLLLPQPDTLVGLVEKAREFDQNWRMFTDPMWDQEINSQKIDVFEGGTQGRNEVPKGRRQFPGSLPRECLSPEEKQKHFDKGLCFYCSKPNHKMLKCGVCLYHQVLKESSTPLRTMNMGSETQEQDIYPIDDTNLGQLARTEDALLFGLDQLVDKPNSF